MSEMLGDGNVEDDSKQQQQQQQQQQQLEEEVDSGLRRSKRVPHRRVRDLEKAAEEEEARLAEEEAARRRKEKMRNTKKQKRLMEEKAKKAEDARKRRQKEKGGKPGAAKTKKNGSATSAASGNSHSANQLQEPSLTEENWTPNMPLLNSEFRNHHSILSRLKNPNMRPLPYGGDLMKFMSFINKFHMFCDPELLNASFQDFEIGLNLYPGPSPADNPNEKPKLYQDYIPAKNIVACQDKVNLFFLTLLKLTFASLPSSGKTANHYKPQANIKQLYASKKAFAGLIDKLRNSAREWGYPQEWCIPLPPGTDISKPKSQLFPTATTESEPGVEVLTPNIYAWYTYSPLPLEEDPLQTSDLERNGVLALDPPNRVILLRALVDWCTAFSPLVHNEIHRLTHFRKDPAFGVHTQHVPRFFLEGTDVTFNKFRKLCNLIQNKYEIRSKRKYYKKQLADGKKDDLKRKLELIKELKASLKPLTKEEKDEAIISYYQQWCELFEGELSENPLSNPFEDDLYKLRSQEFFISRVPYVGDFYIPRLHTYSDAVSPITTYTDLLSLQSLLEKSINNEIDALELFENDGQTMSTQFKLLYRDTPALIQDYVKGVSTKDKVYWYEMSHDAESLKEFAEFLNYKITPPEPKPPKDAKQAQEGNHFAIVGEGGQVVTEENSAKEKTPEDKASSKEKEKSKVKGLPITAVINKHPLPKEYRFNFSRAKLKALQDYLLHIHHLLHEFEILRVQYAGMTPGKRALRRVQRRNIDYDMGFNESDDDQDEYEASDIDEQIEDEEELEYSEGDEENDDYAVLSSRRKKKARKA